MNDKTAELVQRVLEVVAKEHPESAAIRVFESALIPEPMFFCKGSEFFDEIYKGKVEAEILQGSPSVALPDMDEWLKTLGKTEVDYIKDILNIKYIPKEIAIAFAVLHEMYHAMRFIEVDALQFAKYWASLNEGVRKSYEGSKQIGQVLYFSRKNKEEIAADEFAAKLLKEQWDVLFPSFVSYAAFSGTFPLDPTQLESFMPTHVSSAPKQQNTEVSFEERLALVKQERMDRQRKREESSLFGRLKKKVCDTVNNIMNIDISVSNKAVKTFLGGVFVGAAVASAAAVALSVIR